MHTTTQGTSFWKICAVTLAFMVLALAILLYRSGAQTNRHEVDLNKLAERVQSLENHPVEVEGARKFPSTPRVQPNYLPASSPLSGDAAGTTPEEAEAQNTQLLKTLESRFSRQPVDGNAPRVEIDMLQAMNDKQLVGAGIAPKDPDVSCRRDVCRISGVFRSNADAIDWAVLYLTTVGAKYAGNAQSAYTRNPDGSVRVMLYANRPAATP